jgi:uncharacterized protein (DUF1501 family)
MRRRAFLRNTGLAAATLGINILNQGCEYTTNIPKFHGKRLILIKLAGGNDGLFSLIPKEHDIIDSLRPNMAKLAKKNGVSFFNQWLLNYELRYLESFAARGELAILPFVGYPNPNTSHFKSTEIWETGILPGESYKKTGWIGKLLDEGTLSIEGNDTPVLSLADQETLVIRGVSKQGYKWHDNRILEWYGQDISFWLRDNQNSRIAEKLLKEYHLLNSLNKIQPVSIFPDTYLGCQLANVAAIIQNDKPFKVFYTLQQGYDTHISAPERLSKLYIELSDALTALEKTLKSTSHWDDTMIMVYSEFGRTIDENANGGTDHGAAGLALLLGSNQIVKKYASIEPEIKLVPYYNEMYLGHQIDFRDLYADIRMSWLTKDY